MVDSIHAQKYSLPPHNLHGKNDIPYPIDGELGSVSCFGPWCVSHQKAVQS